VSDAVTSAYTAALDGMQRTGPRPLHSIARMLGDIPERDTGQALCEHLSGAGPQDALRQKLAHTLAKWDSDNGDAEWFHNTDNNTPERRAAIMAGLAVDAATADLFGDLFPMASLSSPIVIADDWTEWRTPQRRVEREFYWEHYRRYLEDKGWNPAAVAGLDSATEEVVRRLSDPTAARAYGAKGLVVGHVQSGKTANFTGVIAKAIDAGYRLVIVLTGTTNMLRAQTQRRLDMELCGLENLQIEISQHDPRDHDYKDDPDWIAGHFVVHGGRPSDSAHPDIKRLSNHAGDYKLLRQGFSALDFQKHERQLKLFHPANLYTSDARLVVAKKNSTVLRALVTDLGRISDRLGEVPVLIIDDESDQASVNTTSPAKWRADSRERTAINRHIGDLLKMMARAQYVGYTATPYANVFIDPSDIVDIFPRDFIVALPRPEGYMGAEDFHDFDNEIPLAERPLASSNERAHVRFMGDDPDEEELREALDMFVLTGAVKIHRQRMGRGTYRHHTMLVHEAMKTATHRDTAAAIRALWKQGGYHTARGLTRLRSLYERDVLPVATAVSPDLPTPKDFADLRQDIAEAVGRINPPDHASGPVLVVNSDKDLEQQQESLDFDKRAIWRILVGGNKLARGFTVEGLTTTYYRRSTSQVDTLMQMGRWFGFRPDYRDLVRLYTTADLHAMFAAACQDEEYLRDELRRYSIFSADGTPQLTPREVPPLIAQHRPDLRPTGRNKMWNAQLAEKRSPGQPMEPVAYAKEPKAMGENVQRWLPILAKLDQSTPFVVPGARTHYQADYGVIKPAELLAVLRKIEWLVPGNFGPDLAWLSGLSTAQLQQWVVFVPRQTNTLSLRTIDGVGPFSIFNRKRTGTGALAVASEGRHRNAAYRIAGLPIPATEPGRPPKEIWDPEADRLRTLLGEATGAMVLYPTTVADPLPGATDGPIEPESLTMAFHMITPSTTAPTDGRLTLWRTKDSSKPQAVVVDV